MLGQVMLILALGLMVAQIISATLLLRGDEQRRSLTVVNELTLRFVNARERDAEQDLRRARREERRAARREALQAALPQENAETLAALAEPPPVRQRRGPRAGIERSAAWPGLAGDKRLTKLEPTLSQALADQGVNLSEVIIVRRKAGADPVIQNRPRLRDRLHGENWRSRPILVAGIKREGSDQWEIARAVDRERPREVLYMLAFQTLVIFAVLFALMYLMMRRITRPLAQLTSRVDAFSRNPDAAEVLEETGPQDTRQLIAAHNAMEARVAALLDEKDVMLGAIGHDLKTPLAALRVRIESVADATQRERMVSSIHDITHTLDDILSLARIGRSGVEFERVDLAALTASVVEEFEDLGEPVTLDASTKSVREVQVTWLKRALRNLVSNALRYGHEAKVSLLTDNGQAILRVDDIGPGIPDGEIAAMLEPFKRGEASRNRSTGGAGLGLTLARAITEQHGGELRLSNRMNDKSEKDGPIAGLRAEIILP